MYHPFEVPIGKCWAFEPDNVLGLVHELAWFPASTPLVNPFFQWFLLRYILVQPRPPRGPRQVEREMGFAIYRSSFSLCIRRSLSRHTRSTLGQYSPHHREAGPGDEPLWHPERPQL